MVPLPPFGQREAAGDVLGEGAVSHAVLVVAAGEVVAVGVGRRHAVVLAVDDAAEEEGAAVAAVADDVARAALGERRRVAQRGAVVGRVAEVGGAEAVALDAAGAAGGDVGADLVGRRRRRAHRHRAGAAEVACRRLDEAELAARRIAAEEGERVARRAGRQHVGAVGRDRHAARTGHAGDAADSVLLLLDVGEGAGAGVAREDAHRVVARRRGVEVLAVGARHRPGGAGQTVDAAAVVDQRRRRQQPAEGDHGVAGEAGDGVVAGRGGVDEGAVGTGDGAARRGERVATRGGVVAHALHEGEGAGRRVARVGGDAVLVGAGGGGVDGQVVRAHRHARRLAQVGAVDDAAGAAHLAVGRVARQDEQRVAPAGGDVDVLAVGAHHDAGGALERPHPVLAGIGPVAERLLQGQRAAAGVAAVDLEAAVALRGAAGVDDVDVLAVSARGDRLRAAEARAVGTAVDDRRQSDRAGGDSDRDR